MKLYKQIVSVALAFILVFTSLPFQFFDSIPYVYGEESPPIVDIAYDDFTDSADLQLNGDSLIENNAIRFESGGSTGESVFTTNKLTLGEDLSFSTSFSFRNTSPPVPLFQTSGGFTFTLQPIGNTVAASDFQDESIKPSLSIAITAEYLKSKEAASLMKQDRRMYLASLTGIRLATEPIARCGLSVTPYLDGDYNNSIHQQRIDAYDTVDETIEYYHVWIGYDGKEKLLYTLFLKPSGEYDYFSYDMELADVFTDNEVYAGFMGSLGNAGNISEIKSWHFKNDLSILDEAAAAADEAWLISEMEGIENLPSESLYFPNSGRYGSSISWVSSNIDVVAEDGTVNPPSIEQGDQTVTLTATVAKGSSVRTTSPYTLTIKVPEGTIVDADYAWLSDSLILNENESLENVISALNLPASGQYGSSISWSSTNTSIADLDGSVTRPSYFEGDQEVTLTAHINVNDTTWEKPFHITVKALGTSAAEIIAADKLWLTGARLLNGNSSLDRITKSLSLPLLSPYGSTISWESSDEDVIALSGAVTRPTFVQGNQTVTLTATIKNGEAMTENTFTLIVLMKDEDVVFADGTWLTDTLVLNGQKSTNNVVANLKLPPFGVNGSKITWTSSNRSVVAANGQVTRPVLGSGNAEVTLTATITYGDTMPVTCSFYVTVRAMGLSDAELAAKDRDWLTDLWVKGSNISLNMVFSDLNFPTMGGAAGSAISWESSNEGVVDSYGKVTRPAFTQGDKTVTLTATISNGVAAPITKTFTVTVRTLGKTDEEKYIEDTGKVNADYEWLAASVILKENSALNHITGNLNLPTLGSSGSSISWTSTDSTVVNANGIVKRPSFTQGTKTVTLTASISKGAVSPKTKTFTVTVIKLEQTDEEKLQADAAWLTDTQILNKNTALDHIIGNLTLPVEGPLGTTISWTSDKEMVVDREGKVTRQTYTHGDETVTLTAMLSNGASATKTFTIKVIRLAQTNEEKSIEQVNADFEWLVDSIILNKNTKIHNVTGNLILPVEGVNGSDISWTSDNEAVVAVDGTVKRPTYTQGSKNVVLTAVISKGLYSKEKIFQITVVRFISMSAEEEVARDYEWLTEASLLNGNSSLDHVTTDLKLPLKGVGGSAGSDISWESNSRSFVRNEGDVYRPMFHLGDQTVTLTATIRRGPVSMKKTFVVVVKCLDLTDGEAVEETVKWLKRYNTLGGNPSGNSVTQNLSFPTSGLYDAAISWSTDRPDIITQNGAVTRPENRIGNRRVNVTASVTKGSQRVDVSYQYIVLEKPDTSAPVVTGTTPGNRSTGVLWDTNKIILTYNENIILMQNQGIELKAADVNQLTATVDNNKLILTPYAALSSGENRLLIPAGAITDKAGNPVEAYEFMFTVEEKPVKNIEVIISNPYDMEKEVDHNIYEMTFRFNSTTIVKGQDFDNLIRLRTSSKAIPVTYSLSGDTVTMRLKEKLAPATVYEIVIPEGVVQDRFQNKNSSTYIKFVTKGLLASKRPEVASVYPVNGQNGVSVNSNIEVVFTNVQNTKNCPFKLTDESGREYQLYAPYTLDLFDTKLIFKSKEALKPNTVYTLSAPCDNALDISQLEFSTQFTTGSGICVTKASPSTGDWNAPTSGIVEIQFPTPVTKGVNFEDIVFEDFLGNPVEFIGEEAGSKVILRSLSELNLYHAYSIHIPKGAYINAEGIENDQNKFTFFTTKEKISSKLELTHLDIQDIGFQGKAFKLSVDIAEITSWENSMRAFGYGPVSYQWKIDGNLVSTNKLYYRTFSSPGEHEIALTAKDKYGYTYEVKKTIEIKALQDTTLTLKDRGVLRTVYTYVTGTQSALDFELFLEQDNQFIYGENISVKLYKDGILQPFHNYGDGGITISSQYADNAYKYTYTPKYGDSGTYELRFTYNGLNGEQTIRQPFIVKSINTGVTEVFRFRLYEDRLADYYEDQNYMYVLLNGERIKANKEMYTYNGLTFPVYAIRKKLQSDTYYSLKVENWYWGRENIPFYIGKDTDNPTILSGSRGSAGKGMQIKNVTINSNASDLKDNHYTYFEGMSTKLVFSVEGDWNSTDIGYYEVATLSYGEGASLYGDTGFKIQLKQEHNSKNETQKIIVKPGIQLKDKKEQYWIRMVSAQGFKSAWKQCPNVNLCPVPSILGKKLNISVQDGEYVVDWPTVFDGPIGASIGYLDGIPVIDGGNFSIGGSMPKFEGKMTEGDTIELNFEAKGGYGEKHTTSKDTKYKKVKKITVVGYEFEIELEGGVFLEYDWSTGQWKREYLFILVDGFGYKSWDKGYKMLGVGFTAGVGVGARAYGALIIENETDYSGIIRLTPYANLHVDGNFGVANVKGSLEASLPAEIHFPTGYIGADISVDALIEAEALLWSKTLYKKNLAGVHWDNGKDKVGLSLLLDPMEISDKKDGSGLQLMARDYLNKPSNWLGGTNSDMTRRFSSIGELSFMGAEKETNPKVADLLENIFPKAETKLVTNGDRQWLVWNDDNPSRDEINRTQLRYSVFVNGAWSLPKWLYDDGTADFDPAVAVAGNGVLMAWHNIGKVLTAEEGLDEMLNSSEISVTESIYSADGSQPAVINLTNDDKLDHSPNLAADGDKALLVWTKSDGLSLNLNLGESSSAIAGDRLYFSSWSDGIWADPEAMDMDTSTILDSSLTMKGEEGLLLYTLDMDNNLLTGEDREAYARHYDGNHWGQAIALTSNALNDSAPKAVYMDGQWFITWLEAGKILYKAGLEGETKSEDLLANIQSDYQITATEGESPLVALVYTQAGADMTLELYASFYDIGNEKWSQKIGLVTGDKYVGAISTSFTEDGKLHAAFTQADIITEAKTIMKDGVEELVEGKNKRNKTDLKLLTYMPIHDVALQEDGGIYLSTEYPLPGAVTTVYLTLENKGDFTENAAIYLYDGDPDNGGIKIAEAASQLVSAHSSKEIEIEWLVGQEDKNEYDLYAVIHASDGVQEANVENNTANLKVYASDIAITGLTCENPAADDYLINITVANRGSKLLEGAKLWLEGEGSGAVLETTPLKPIELGEETVLTYMLSSNEQRNMRARITLPEGVRESNTTNNTRTFVLEPVPFVIKSLNIGPWEEQVDLDTVIGIEFNMSIGNGSGFDQIRLIDEGLNLVAIDKIIEDNILTIKPQNLLEHGTSYRLVVPVDALRDSAGHALENAFDMSFTTRTTNPEIVAAYPGAGMANTALDTAIRLRFNQKVIRGSEFSNISLYEHQDGAETAEIPVMASIEGELLTMSYTGKLSENTTYTLEIPRGAIENDSGETQAEDYIQAFTTAGVDEGAEEPGDGQLPDHDNIEDNTEDQAGVELGGIIKSVQIQKKGNYAIINLGDLAAEVFNQTNNATINIPVIPGADAYTLEMPAEALTVGGSSLRVNTVLGNVLIPSGMLSTMKEISGKAVGLTIAAADKSTLPEAARAAIGNRPVIELILRLDGVKTAWSNPTAPVWVSIPYNPAAEELGSLESIVIWYIDENGNVTTVQNGYYSQSDASVSFSTTHFSDFAVAYNRRDFKDIPESSWYNSAVSFIAARGITDGIGNGKYGPDCPLTRGQFITMLMKAYGMEPDASPKDSFADAGSTWYTGYLAAAKRLGISAGVGNNRFAPEKEITRQEMFTLLYNALRTIKQLPETNKAERALPVSPLSEFIDQGEIASWAREAMTQLVEAGTISGNAGKLSPLSTSTRAELAQVLYNLMTR